ncbi:barrier-to-autointegration factor [Huso huso]|uniref:Barrier-to-autointegration factor n=2 Tax=Huso huso TaxID=61971 RepID=A0ABR0YYM5_HUSHU
MGIRLLSHSSVIQSRFHCYQLDQPPVCLANKLRWGCRWRDQEVGIWKLWRAKAKNRNKDSGALGRMSSTSQKHKEFVAEPMGEKPVTALAGIGEALGGRLESKGFDKAYVVLGQFLVLKKEEELFRDWLKDTCGANSKQQKDCFSCLKEWCDSFL